MTRTPDRGRTRLALTATLTTLASLLLLGVQAPPAHAAAERGVIRSLGGTCLTAPHWNDWNGRQVTYERCANVLNTELWLRQSWTWQSNGFITSNMLGFDQGICLDTSYGQLEREVAVTLGYCQWGENRQRWARGITPSGPIIYPQVRSHLVIGSGGRPAPGVGARLEGSTGSWTQALSLDVS